MLQVPVTSVLLAPADELLYVYDMARALSQLRYFAVTMFAPAGSRMEASGEAGSNSFDK